MAEAFGDMSKASTGRRDMLTKRNFFDMSAGYVDGIDMTTSVKRREVKIAMPVILISARN